MLSSFGLTIPCLRTQDLIRKWNSLGEHGSINLSRRLFSTLRDGYNFLSASSLWGRRASSLLSLITSCTLKAATDYCSQNMCSFKKKKNPVAVRWCMCQMCSKRLLTAEFIIVKDFQNEQSSGNRPLRSVISPNKYVAIPWTKIICIKVEVHNWSLNIPQLQPETSLLTGVFLSVSVSLSLVCYDGGG